MAKSKKNMGASVSGAAAIAAKMTRVDELSRRIEKLERELPAELAAKHEGLERKVDELANVPDKPFARLEKLEKDFAELIRAGALSAEAGVLNVRGSIDLAARVERLEASVLPSATPAGDNAAANAATREALHKEIAVVVEQRLAGAYMDATSAQIANVESRMRAELQALLEKALAFDGAIGKSIRDAVAARTAAAAPDRSGEQPSRGHRSAVRPVAK